MGTRQAVLIFGEKHSVSRDISPAVATLTYAGIRDLLGERWPMPDMPQ